MGLVKMILYTCPVFASFHLAEGSLPIRGAWPKCQGFSTETATRGPGRGQATTVSMEYPFLKIFPNHGEKYLGLMT